MAVGLMLGAKSPRRSFEVVLVATFLEDGSGGAVLVVAARGVPGIAIARDHSLGWGGERETETGGVSVRSAWVCLSSEKVRKELPTGSFAVVSKAH